ncbi:MAG: hypothetical protein V4629_07995 [Pseudomonadota bacterium]
MPIIDISLKRPLSQSQDSGLSLPIKKSKSSNLIHTNSETMETSPNSNHLANPALISGYSVENLLKPDIQKLKKLQLEILSFSCSFDQDLKAWSDRVIDDIAIINFETAQLLLVDMIAQLKEKDIPVADEN